MEDLNIIIWQLACNVMECFQGGASFVDHLCYFRLVFCYAFVRICLLMPCGHLLGKH